MTSAHSEHFQTLNAIITAKQYNALSDYALKRSERYLFHLGQSLAFIYKSKLTKPTALSLMQLRDPLSCGAGFPFTRH